MKITLIRHGQSAANIGKYDITKQPDSEVPLTAIGKTQAYRLGHQLGEDFFKSSIIYYSPYKRTRHTLNEVIHGSLRGRKYVNIRKNEDEAYYFKEDPRIREIEFGYKDIDAQHHLRPLHGWFYYRHDGGESYADVYNRADSFLSSLFRNYRRYCNTYPKTDNRHCIIVTHGAFMRCFVMRFMHLTVEQMNSIDNTDNCGMYTIEHKNKIERPDFVYKNWAVTGLKFRN